MRPAFQGASLLAFVASIACHDPSGPVTVSALFVLESIGGREVPTSILRIQDPPELILWASLSLDKAGKALMTDARRDMIHGGDVTYTNTFDYRIDGDRIEIGSFQPCPINAICAANWLGTIDGSRLALTMFPTTSQGPIVYLYRIPPSL